MRDIANFYECSINDVGTTGSDAALNEYLRSWGVAVKKPLVCLMAFSGADKGSNASGNNVSAELVELGPPKAGVLRRLKAVRESINAVKRRVKSRPQLISQPNTAFIFAADAFSDNSALMRRRPNSNFLVSNMVGPKKPLFLAGMPMVGFQGLPIVPLGGGLNVTFASFQKNMCFAVGASTQAMRDPSLFCELLVVKVDELEKGVCL